MTFRWIPWEDLSAWLAKGWRLSKAPVASHHARYQVLIVREG